MKNAMVSSSGGLAGKSQDLMLTMTTALNKITNSMGIGNTISIPG
jgi:hypothetical protein